MADLIGRTIPHYKIIEQVGQGGWALFTKPRILNSTGSPRSSFCRRIWDRKNPIFYEVLKWNLWLQLIKMKMVFTFGECPSIPGCISQGQTEAEALKNIQEAIK